MKWNFVYEEEHPDTNGYCSAGIISNGKNFLFFTICADDPDTQEVCRIYNSIDFSEESLECQYPWTAENDEILLNCLNGLQEQNSFCGDDGPLKTLHFLPFK